MPLLILNILNYVPVEHEDRQIVEDALQIIQSVSKSVIIVVENVTINVRFNAEEIAVPISASSYTILSVSVFSVFTAVFTVYLSIN